MDAASAGGQPAVILLSSVLSYLESPHALLADVVDRGFRHVVIDRTLFASGDRDRLAVQRVPPAIYEASYPCWLFSRQGVLRHFAEDYRLVTEWTLPNDFNASAKFIGLLWQRKSS
jgi:putative methyltransferase (TIGR04325 family)